MPENGIAGTGIDLVENDRMRHVLDRWGDAFKNRVFLKSEQDYCDSKAVPNQSYAARFAVKEAVAKAFGTGMTPQLGWLDIEVMRNPGTGAPSVKLSAKGEKLAEERAVTKILISLSHTHSHAVAQAILVVSG